MDAAEWLATRAWQQFTEGFADDQLLEETFSSEYPWERLIQSESPAIALGSLLIWLRSRPTRFVKEHVGKVLDSVNPGCRATADWLTMYLTKGDPESHYRHNDWNRLLKNTVPLALLQSLLGPATSYDKYLMHTGLLQAFEESEDRKQHVSRTVLEWTKAPSDPETAEWISDLLTYPPLLEAIFELEPRFAFWGPYDRDFVQTSEIADFYPRVQAARGLYPTNIQDDRLEALVEPTEAVSRQWPQSPSWLDADEIIHARRVNLVEIAQSLGVPVYVYHAPDAAWEGAVRWDKKYMRPCIVLRRPQSEERFRFTFAHELGHLWLNTLKIDEVEGESRFWSGEEERDANKFASRLLVPARVIRNVNSWNIERLTNLAKLCDVSFQVAAISVISVHQNHGLVVAENGIVSWTWFGNASPTIPLVGCSVDEVKVLLADERKRLHREYIDLRFETIQRGSYFYFWVIS